MEIHEVFLLFIMVVLTIAIIILLKSSIKQTKNIDVSDKPKNDYEHIIENKRLLDISNVLFRGQRVIDLDREELLQAFSSYYKMEIDPYCEMKSNEDNRKLKNRLNEYNEQNKKLVQELMLANSEIKTLKTELQSWKKPKVNFGISQSFTDKIKKLKDELDNISHSNFHDDFSNKEIKNKNIYYKNKCVSKLKKNELLEALQEMYNYRKKHHV
jgi:hypothetical protein